MYRLIGQVKLSMRSCKVSLKLGQYLLRRGSRLSRTTCIREQSGVENKSKCNINNHRIAVGLSSGYHKGLIILDLLEQCLDRLVGII
jgi:hypothetical protein